MWVRVVKIRKHWWWWVTIIDLIWVILMGGDGIINRYIVSYQNVICTADRVWLVTINEMNLRLLINWNRVCYVWGGRVGGGMNQKRHWWLGVTIIDLMYCILMGGDRIINRYIFWYKNVICSAYGGWSVTIFDLKLGLMMNWNLLFWCGWGWWKQLSTDDGGCQ